MSGVIVGIDLGTTNSLVAVSDERGPRVLLGADGSALVPSVVRYESGGVVVGAEARARAAEFPRSTVMSVKRLMGRSLRDAACDAAMLPYRVVEGANATARVAVRVGETGAERVVSPQEVSAEVLRALKERAEAALGVPVSRAVVTVPAYFDDAQRQATRDAGRLAGLEVVRIVNEPTAAALAYGLGLRDAHDPRWKGVNTVAVYDLGGGTFDISVLRLTAAEPCGDGLSFFEVLSTAGDTRLGGDDLDRALAEVILREAGVGAAGASPAEVSAARAEAERIKVALSERESAAGRVEFAGGRSWSREVTRAELEELAEPLVRRTLECCRRALSDASRAGGGEIGAVVLVGGSTRMPLVRRRVAEQFGMEPYCAVDPDQAVALGAAVQASVLSGRAAGALLLDVIPLSLGIETAGGAVAKVIMRNSTVPARAREMFSTQVDDQSSIKLNIVQGEREMAADCRSLGEFHLRGIPPMPAGVPQVEVEFLVDANGVLSVSARERRSGRRASLQVIPNHGLSRDEVERMERESVTHAREDMTRHRITDLVANAGLDLKWIGEGLARHGAKLGPPYRAQLDGLAAALRGMVERAKADWRSVDADELYRAKEALDRASLRLQEVSIAESLRSEGGRGEDPGASGR